MMREKIKQEIKYNKTMTLEEEMYSTTTNIHNHTLLLHFVLEMKGINKKDNTTVALTCAAMTAASVMFMLGKQRLRNLRVSISYMHL